MGNNWKYGMRFILTIFIDISICISQSIVKIDTRSSSPVNLPTPPFKFNGESYEMGFPEGANMKPPGEYYTSLGAIICNFSSTRGLLLFQNKSHGT